MIDGFVFPRAASRQPSEGRGATEARGRLLQTDTSVTSAFRAEVLRRGARTTLRRGAGGVVARPIEGALDREIDAFLRSTPRSTGDPLGSTGSEEKTRTDLRFACFPAGSPRGRGGNLP